MGKTKKIYAPLYFTGEGSDADERRKYKYESYGRFAFIPARKEI